MKFNKEQFKIITNKEKLTDADEDYLNDFSDCYDENLKHLLNDYENSCDTHNIKPSARTLKISSGTDIDKYKQGI